MYKLRQLKFNRLLEKTHTLPAFGAFFSHTLYIDMAVIIYIQVKKIISDFINFFLNLRNNSIILD